MDIAFIKQYIPMYVEAGKLTLGIAFLGILFSLLIGFAASLILYYKVPLWRRVVQIYVELSRNTPLLVQLFFLILPTVLSQKILRQTESFVMLSAFFLPVKHFIVFYRGFKNKIFRKKTKNIFS